MATTILPGQRATELIRQRIEYWDALATRALEMVMPDGMMPGMEKAGPEKRRARYAQVTTPEEMAYLSKDDYLQGFIENRYPAPTSQYWQRLLLTIPEFEETRRDMIRLFKREQSFA